jgi:hypothetical protein
MPPIEMRLQLPPEETLLEKYRDTARQSGMKTELEIGRQLSLFWSKPAKNSTKTLVLLASRRRERSGAALRGLERRGRVGPCPRKPWQSGSMSPEEVDWSAYPGPSEYNPKEVPVALRALGGATDQAEAQAAYHQFLFAVGNNHRGTLYACAPVAVPFLVAFVREGSPWAKWAALECLTDAFTFGSHDEASAGAPEAFRANVAEQAADLLLALLADPAEREDLRVDAIGLLDDIPAVEPRLAAIMDEIVAVAAKGSSRQLDGVAAAALRWRKARHEADSTDDR